jgi:hypothetical protein
MDRTEFRAALRRAGLYVSIRDEDLAARRFDRTWIVLQCG